VKEVLHHPECAWAPGNDEMCSCAGRGPVITSGEIAEIDVSSPEASRVLGPEVAKALDTRDWKVVSFSFGTPPDDLKHVTIFDPKLQHDGDEHMCSCIACVSWREARANR